MVRSKAMVICGDGINCERETAWALRKVGFDAEAVHVSDLLKSPQLLDSRQLIVFPGGFSFGDEIASGKVLAVKIRQRLLDPLHKFIDSGRLILGICNGFQVLVQLGLLPDSDSGASRLVSLVHNESGRFINRWVDLDVDDGRDNPFLRNLSRISLPVRHGEGRLFVRADAGDQDLALVSENGILRYCEDINGSFQKIAGLKNKKGNILGLMPHPEAFMRRTQHPAWTGQPECMPDGLAMLSNAAEYLRG